MALQPPLLLVSTESLKQGVGIGLHDLQINRLVEEPITETGCLAFLGLDLPTVSVFPSSRYCIILRFLRQVL